MHDGKILIFDYIQLKVLDASPGKVRFELDIQKEHTVNISSYRLILS